MCSDIAFRRNPVGMQVILTEAYRGFPQSVQSNAGTVPSLGHHLFPKSSFNYHLSFDAIQP
jgi:hypothetical protein